MTDENDDMPMNISAAGADLDLLESYLDDALAPAEAAALLVRLSVDAALAGTLDELRAERAGRAPFWASLEPTDRAVDQLTWRVRGAVAAQSNGRPANRVSWGVFQFDALRIARFAGLAAACVVLGFVGGRLGRGPASQNAVATNLTNVSATGSTAVANSAPVNPGFTSVGSVGTPVYVPIANDLGQIVDYQRFPNAEQAQHFVDDLRRTQTASGGTTGDGSVRTVNELRY